jgi:hypothetical protein
MFRTEGARGFMKGIVPGLLRDVPGTGVYFWTYHYLKTWMDLHELSDAKGRRGYQYLQLMLSGGLAGQISWLVAYPFDVIKTKI